MSFAMMAERIAVRLIPAEELAGDQRPEACVEVAFGPRHPGGETDMLVVPAPLRITPADLARLRMETELAMSEIRTEVMRAEIAWQEALGSWHAEGRAAVEAGEPDVALLTRVLEGLRRLDLVSASAQSSSGSSPRETSSP